MGLVWCAVGAVGDGNTTGPQVPCDAPADEWEFIRQPGTYVTQQIAASDRVALYNSQVGQYVAE